MGTLTNSGKGDTLNLMKLRMSPFFLLVLACATQQGLTDEELRAEVEQRLASGRQETCRDVEVVERIDGGTTYTAWGLSARCRYETADHTAPEVTRSFVATVQPASSHELRSLRRVPNLEQALAAGRPVELPEGSPSTDAIAAIVYLVLPALIALVIGGFTVFLLTSRRRERLARRPGAGIRVPHERPRPGQSRSHWTINRD